MNKVKVYKLKNDKIEIFLAWISRLKNEFRTEALNTLEEEKVVSEYYGIFSIAEDSYIVSYMESKEEIGTAQNRWINEEHKKVKKECFEYPIETLDLLYLTTS